MRDDKVVIYTMKTSDSIMFRNLCRDFGYDYLGLCSEILSVCQSLKTRLVTAAEDVECYHAYDGVADVMGKYFKRGYMITPFRSDMNPVMFKTLYQIACWPLKIKSVEVTAEQEHAYVKSFKRNEQSCEQWTETEATRSLLVLARIILVRALPGLSLACEDIRHGYRHGPGAVLEGVSGSDKNEVISVSTQLAEHYPLDSFFANAGLACDCMHRSAQTPLGGSGDRVCIRDEDIVETYDEAISVNRAKLTLVAKDHKGPRGIFVHSVGQVMVRQAQRVAFRAAFSRGPYARCYNPKDQSVQQERAFIGSANRQYYTLDLKDASDLIPVKLVEILFGSADRGDTLGSYLFSARTKLVKLPTEKAWHELHMFAPMGDPMCFDILSLVVWSIATAGTALRVVRPGMTDAFSTEARLAWINGNCMDIATVFGDDLIGRSQYYSYAAAALEAVNLKVNRNKSFYRGDFREACGMDAFQGVCVTPLRQKISWDCNLKVVDKIELHNRFVLRYPTYNSSILWMRAQIEQQLQYRLALTSRSDRDPTLFQALPGEDIIGHNMYRAKWTFEFSGLGGLIIKLARPSVPRVDYPFAEDRRYDLSYALIKTEHTDDDDAHQWWDDHRVMVRGSERGHVARTESCLYDDMLLDGLLKGNLEETILQLHECTRGNVGEERAARRAQIFRRYHEEKHHIGA